jgi:hypothetical protein
MKMPPKSASIEEARERLHQEIAKFEAMALGYTNDLATSGIADQRWCAIARTHLEEGAMALHRAIRDYPGNDPNQYGKVPLDKPLPREFTPPPAGDFQETGNRKIGEQRKVDWKDYSAGEKLDPPDRPEPED